MPKIQDVLNSLIRRNERILHPRIKEWMDFTQKQIRQDLASKYQKDVTSELTDWELIQSKGVEIIKPAAVEIMQFGGNAAYKHLAITGSFDIINVQAVKAVEKFCSKLVVDVTAKTKQGINTYIKYGIKQGYSMPKIARDLRPLVGLTSNQTQSIINYRNLLTVKRPDFTAAQIDRAVMKYTNKTHRMRMESIARTETARAQNIGYCQGLEQVGVEEAEFSVSATDFCEECEALNGKRFKVGEAAGIIPVHPKCRCAMLPVISDKVISEQLRKPPSGIGVLKLKALSKIESVDPPEESVVLKQYAIETMSQKQAMKLSQELRETYAKYLDTRNFGEMENAVLAYDSARTLAFVDEQIVGAISFHYDEVSKVVWISHTGTLMSPKGTGAELVRTAVDATYGGKWGMSFESTYEAIPFWIRLGFIQNKKVPYIFEADPARVAQIRKALGTVGRVKEKIGVELCV